MTSEVVPKHEKRWLRYDFSAVEIHDLSLEMANKTQELSQVQQEKKSVTSSFKSKIDTLSVSVNSLADKVSSGYEIREVQCDIKYHKPKQGMKTLTRKDTGVKIEEKMSDSDYNLWTQMEEEESGGDKGYTKVTMTGPDGREHDVTDKLGGVK